MSALNQRRVLGVAWAMDMKVQIGSTWSPVKALTLISVLLSGCSASRNWVEISRSLMPPNPTITKSSFSAEMEFDTFVEGERLKLDGVWASSTENQFRIDLRSPTGGVVFSLATDGQRLTCYDARAARYFEGAALPRSFDLLLPMAPLNLEGSQWLNLLLGSLDIPVDSHFAQADDGMFRARFQQGAHVVEALVNASGILTQVTIDPDAPAAFVSYGSRDSSGRSTETLIEDPKGRYRMRMRLRDVREVEKFSDRVFQIKVPAGVERVGLDGS